MNAKKFDCNRCKYDRKCDDTRVLFTIPDVVTTRKCLRAMIDDETYEYYRLHKDHGNGVYPFEGGRYQQPARYLEAMAVVDVAIQNATPVPKED